MRARRCAAARADQPRRRRARVRRPRRRAATSMPSSSAPAPRGVNPGYRLGGDYPEYEDGLLVAITERRTQATDRRAGRGRGRRARGGGRMSPVVTDPELDPRADEPDADDLRALGRGPPRVRGAGARRAGGARRRALPACALRRRRRRRCPRSPSRRSCATTTASRRRTSTSTPASTRSARAR